MKIWCVDYAGLSYHVSSHLFFIKAEAEDFYESRNHCGNYVKLYQVEDIWGWCARHFDLIINEVITSRDSGDDYTYIWGMVEEIKEAAAHCGLTEFSADMIIIREDFDSKIRDYALSIAWWYEGTLEHRLYRIEGLDTPYNYPTIVERRSKWEKKN